MSTRGRGGSKKKKEEVSDEEELSDESSSAEVTKPKKKTARQTKAKDTKKTKKESKKPAKESKKKEKKEPEKLDADEQEKIAKLLALDPSKLGSMAEFKTAFDNIADQLMNHHVMVIDGTEYRLAELEFYLNDENHPDVFTHGDDIQKTSGQWYFHRTGSGEKANFKGGPYKGLDITFASRGYGGILIRAIRTVEEEPVYSEGPCNVVNLILEETNAPGIQELVDRDEWSDKVHELGPIYLKPSSTLKKETIETSGRFGLVLRNEAQAPYVLKPYRYMSFPADVRKGRQHLVLELHHKKNSAESIAATTGCTMGQIGKWTKAFDAAKDDAKASSYYAKKLTAAEFSQFYAVLKKESDEHK